MVIAFVTSFFGVVFASPGSTQIYSDHITDEISGRISIAGPMANMVLALIFITLAVLISPFKSYSQIFNLMFLICTVGFSVNSFLATFNLLPLYTLDGTKVLKWNAVIWLIVFAISGIMVISISIGAENMVKLLMG